MNAPFHLAEFIEDELTARGWSRDHFTSQMVDPADAREWGITRLAVDIFLDLREPCVLLGDLASKFSKAFGVDVALFQNLHDRWCEANKPGDAPKKEKL